MPSQPDAQQNGSFAQTAATHAPPSQLFTSAPPVTHIECAQVEHASEPHSVITSDTQMPSHPLLQQNGSLVHTVVTHGSQPFASAPPCAQMLCAQQPSSTVPSQSLSTPSLHASATGNTVCAQPSAPPLHVFTPTEHGPGMPVKHAPPPPGLPSSTPVSQSLSSPSHTSAELPTF